MASPAPLPLTCEEVVGMLMDYLEVTLAPETIDAFDRHLATCPECVAYVATYRKTRDLTSRASQVDMPGDMKRRLRDLLLAHLDRPR
jgi:anti-sigma factor RsiW